jgi:hypothetical protein
MPQAVLLKILPRPCEWINTAKDFKGLAEDAISITASEKTDLYNDLERGDKDHLTKPFFEKSHCGPFSVCSNVTNGATDDSVNGDISGKEMFLRITRSGDRAISSRSTPPSIA